MTADAGFAPDVAPATPRLRRQYAKLCDIHDFDEELQQRIREIDPQLELGGVLHRKYWEFALLALFADDVGALRDDARVLSVAAGHEPVLFWLANRVGKIVATDIYGEGEFAYREAATSMLHEPAAFAPFPYREDRLEVLHMDGTSLEFEDDSFDLVFTLSSIEHFGSLANVERAANEVGRVTRPGGHAFVTTECFVGRHPLNSRLVQTLIRGVTFGRRCQTATPRRRMLTVFTPEELKRHVVRPTRLKLMQRLERDVSNDSWDNLIRWRGAGELTPRTDEPLPHVLLQAHGSPWTSAALPLQKLES